MAEPTNLIADALRGNPGSNPVVLSPTPPLLASTPVEIPTTVPLVAVPPKTTLSLEKSEPIPTLVTPGVFSPPLAPIAPAVPVAAPTPVPVTPATPSLTAPAVPVTEGSKRTFLLILALVVIAAVLLAGGAFWLWQRMTAPAPVINPQSGQPVLKVATPEEVEDLVVVPSAAAYYGVMAASYPNARVYELSNAVVNGTLSYEEDTATNEVVFFLKIQGGNRADRSLVMWLVDEAAAATMADKVAYETMGAAEYGYVAFRVPKGEASYTGVVLSYEAADWEVPPVAPTEKVMDVQL